MRGPTPDRLVSDRFYAEVDRYMRLVGVQALARNDVFFRMSRAAIACDLDWSELHRILGRITSFEDWYAAWAESGIKFARLGGEAERRGRTVTAGEHYLRASMLYHFAQLFTRPENPLRAEGRRLRVEYFRTACPYLRPSIAQVRIPAGSVELPGYFRMPGGPGPHPAVLMLPGANSVKEELHHWGAAMTKRGVATLAVDGPGQGELAVSAGGPALRFEDYVATTTSAFEWLRRHPSIVGRQIAVWGQSTGGQLAIRMAADIPEVAAVVSVGGPYDFRRELTDLTPADVREEARDLHGLSSFEDTASYVLEHGSLNGTVEQLETDLLLVHGARDDLVANEEIHHIRTRAGGRVEAFVYPEGNHGVCNFNTEMTTAMADWVAETLRTRTRRTQQVSKGAEQ